MKVLSNEFEFSMPPAQIHTASFGMKSPCTKCELVQNNAFATFLAAGLAGSINAFISYPLDNFKTRMQTYNFSRLSKCFTATLQSEGLKGLFRGVLPPVVTAAVLKSINFQIYEFTKQKIFAASQGHLTLASAVGGSMSGAFMAVCLTPLELVKIQMQLLKLNSKSFSLPFDERITNFQMTKHILRKIGIIGMYRSFPLTALRDCFGGAVYFAVYENAKRHVRLPIKSSEYALAGAFAGISVWITIFPIDSIKSKMQNNQLNFQNTFRYSSAFEILQETIKTRGLIKALYGGITPVIIRSLPIHALYFIMYENFLTLFGANKH